SRQDDAAAMKLAGIDANLLAALDALLCEKSVTRAARRLGVGQPAVSHALSRLREHFKDELLLLNGRKYYLTARAEKLASVVASATLALSEVFADRPSFDPATSSHRFVIACSDLLGVLVVPELVRQLLHEAPNVEIELRAVAGESKEAVLSAGVDLALGIFEDVPSGINQQSLYDDPPVCVVRANHEQVAERLDLETYSNLPHLEFGAAAEALPGLQIDRALAAIGRSRKVPVRVPYYFLVPQILEHTDHVATLSTRGANLLVKMARLRIVDVPLTLPSYRYSQIWRNTQDDDRAHAWLREQIARICQRRELAVAKRHLALRPGLPLEAAAATHGQAATG
ncbi:MAG: LysR family transcriptional regulator, partial [Polyangiaceae bacterium]